MKRKQEPSTPISSPEGVITGGGKKTFTKRDKASFFLSKMKTPKMRRIWAILLILVILIGGGLILKAFLESQRIVLKVGNYSYTQWEYDKLISEASEDDVSESAARKALVESLAARAAADKLGVLYPTDSAAVTAAAQIKHDTNSVELSDYQKETAYPLIIQPVVTVTEVGGYKAAVVEFPFSRYIFGFFENETTKSQGLDKKLIGNQDAIKKDYEYAQKTAKTYRQAYIDKTKTIDQIVTEVMDDKRLTYGQSGNRSFASLVTSDGGTEGIYGTGQLLPEQYEVMQRTKVGEPSELVEITWGTGGESSLAQIKRGDNTLVAWYFVVTDQKIDARKGIVGQYEALVKEYANE